MSADGSASTLAGLRGKPGISDDLISLEERLFEYRRAIADQVLATDWPPIPDDAIVRDALASGTPLASRGDPSPGAQALREAAAHLGSVLGEPVPDFAALREQLSGTPVARWEAFAEAWYQAAWRGDRRGLEARAAEVGVDVDLMHWAGRQLARPFFERFAKPLRDHPLLREQWSSSAGCPCCGGPPRMGRYDHEEGRRFLWCDLCDLAWYFPRVTCAFCLNQDHKTLGYLTIEELKDYRIDVCEQCHGYLRAVNERERAADALVDFRLEDLATLQLCLLAERDGYRPGTIADRPAVPTSVAGSLPEDGATAT